MNYRADADGNPIHEPDLLAWARWYETADRSIGRDTFIHPSTGQEILVSTVFLGLDHSFFGTAPVLWETMIFWPGSKNDGDQLRYTSRAEAVAGHVAMVEQVKQELTALKGES